MHIGIGELFFTCEMTLVKLGLSDCCNNVTPVLFWQVLQQPHSHKLETQTLPWCWWGLIICCPDLKSGFVSFAKIVKAKEQKNCWMSYFGHTALLTLPFLLHLIVSNAFWFAMDVIVILSLPSSSSCWNKLVLPALLGSSTHLIGGSLLRTWRSKVPYTLQLSFRSISD